MTGAEGDVKSTSVSRGSRGRWAQGSSGNPRGRPRTCNSVAETLRAYLDGPRKGKKRKRVLVERLYSAAIGDNLVPAARLIIETLGIADLEARLIALEKSLDRLEAK